MATAMLTLLGAGSAGAAEVTAAHDNLRTGWYPDEPSLTPELVHGPTFGKVFETPLEGQIYAQPLIADGTLLVATENDLVYGLDPHTGAQRWKLSVGTPVAWNEAGLECEDLKPTIGITGTPVIDTTTNVAYFVANSHVEGQPEPIAWYMHAVKLDNGKEVEGFPVEITGTAQNIPSVTFQATKQLQRPGLLMMNGVVYAGFGSHCDKAPYEGWLVGVSTTTGTVTTKWATAKGGGAIWQAGGGLISDGEGQILFSTGNDAGAPGEWDPSPGPGDAPPEGHLSESVVRVAVQPEGKLKATDFFSPSDNAHLDELDLDLGSSAPIALPSQFGTPSVPDLLVQSGKEGYVYLLNRRNLGGMGQGPLATEHDEVLQKLGPYGGVWDGAAVWPGEGGYLYLPAVSPAGTTTEEGNHLRVFKRGEEAGSPRLSLAATSPDTYAFGSGSPIVTSDGTTGGSAVMWTTWCPKHACEGGGGELRAYAPVPLSPTSLNQLWSAPIGVANKFSRPYASGGYVYVGTGEGHLLAYSGPALTPSSESLELGSAPLGGQLTGQVTFTNNGTSLTVKAVNPPSGPFHVTGLPTPGQVIKPGESITVGVTFESAAAGSFTGSLGLTTEAGETDVALSASATAPTTEPEETTTTPSPKQQATATTASFQSPPAGAPVISPPVLLEPLAGLAALKIRSPAGSRGRSRHQALLTYTLSRAATVEVVVERRIVSHRCQNGARSCVRYVPTKIRLAVAGRAAGNRLTLDLAGLAPNLYRILATPLARSGARGVTRTLYFRLGG